MLELLTTLIEVVLPVFFVVAVGAVLGRVLNTDHLSLNRIALYGATPALIFRSLANTELELTSAVRLLSGLALILISMLALSALATLRLSGSQRRATIVGSLYSNAGNLMLPVTLFALGEAGLERALLLFVVSVIILYVTAPILLAGRSVRLPWRKLIGMPVIWASVAALTVNILNLTVPLGLAQGVGLLADAAIPIILLVLGIQIQRTGVPLPRPTTWLATGLKLLVGPVIGFTAATVVGASGTDRVVLTLLSAMPPAINTFMLALEFAGEEEAEELSRTVVFSTVCSIVTITVLVSILTR